MSKKKIRITVFSFLYAYKSKNNGQKPTKTAPTLIRNQILGYEKAIWRI